jgi:transposase InsO family protein
LPFKEFSVLDQRRQLTHRVLEERVSVSQAAREFEVSRQTAHFWVNRARDLAQLSDLQSRSRRPHVSPRQSPPEIEALVLALAVQRPNWGGRKIHAALWPEQAPVCSRTVERILARHLGSKPRKACQPMVRFERASCNELWQADFKALGANPPPFRVLSVIDDHSRFIVSLRVVPRATNEDIFAAFWDIFGLRGLPLAVLTDNEACFHTTYGTGLSFFEARLLRLGVRSLHGRPAHPQTQGKVERFHKTMEQEVKGLGKERDPERVQARLDHFAQDYNWNRPNEALQNKKPGIVYRPSERARPSQLPEQAPIEGSEVRRVNQIGGLKRKGVEYYLGRGLAHETVFLVPTPEGLVVTYANEPLALLEDLKM